MVASPQDAHNAEPSRSVVDRALAIIGTFQSGCERQSLSGLSRRCGLPIATSYRIVQRLTSWGALERDDDGKYRIGLRLWEVASLAPRSMDLQRLARPFMQDLYEVSHLNVQLAIRDGHELISIENFRHPTLSSVRSRVGGRYGLLHSTAIGLVLLAHAEPQARDEILAGPLRRHTELTIVDPADLVHVLTGIRRRGYAVSDRQVTPHHLGVAAPVFAPDGSVLAALSLVGRHETADVRGMTHSVRLSATGISRALRDSGSASPPW